MLLSCGTKIKQKERCAVDREEKCEVTGGDSGDCSLHEDTGNRVNEKSLVQQAEECRLAISNKAGVQEAVEALHEEATKICTLLKEFTTISSAKSKLFAFWGEMVKLLQFIKSERTGNRELHLKSVAAMVPHFFAMNRPNYARWLPVYIMDMRSWHRSILRYTRNSLMAITLSVVPTSLSLRSGQTWHWNSLSTRIRSLLEG